MVRQGSMLYHNIRVLAHLMWAVDSLMAATASALVYFVGAWLTWWIEGDDLAILTFVSCLFLAFALFGARMQLYQARRTETLSRELKNLFEVLACAFGSAALISEVVTAGLPGIVYAAMFVCSACALLVLRAGLRISVRYLRRRGKDERYWLLVGRNLRSGRLAESVIANPHFGIRIKQIVDLSETDREDNRARLQPFEREPLKSLPFRILEGAEGIRPIAASQILDEVVVMLPMRTHYDEIRRILEVCVEAGIPVKLPPDHFEANIVKTELSLLGSLPMVTHFTGPSNHLQLVAKRVTDVVGSLLGLVVLSPLLLAITASVRLSSPGPVFFRQTRVGLSGRRFRMLKFRTMVKGAPRLRRKLAALNQTDGIAFKIENDPRITAVGKILRRYHLDELPQLWNVLVGDMSLVGPRPLPPREASGSEWWQRRRLSMPPGLTCLWQVQGNHRIPFRHWMEMDLEYIDRWSFWLDLRLIAATFGTLRRGTGW